jgi:tRNA(Ile)-lysidine synthase
MRYRALLDYMKKIGAQRICLGHNLDDMLETFFMNLLRGSGTRGLKSIPPVRLPFIRPLINVKKQEILTLLQRRGLSYSLDKTNIRLDFRRNLLRHKVIPELVQINPEIHKTIKREIEILRQDDEYLEAQAERVYKKVVTDKKNYASLDLKRILRYNQSIISRVVMKIIKELRGDLKGYETKHFDEIVGLKHKENGKKIHLPKGLYAQREYGAIIIGHLRVVQPRRIVVRTKGKAVISGKMVIRTRITPNFDVKKRKPQREIFDLHKIEQPLFVRTRMKGDVIMTKIGRKSIKNVFNEFRVPYHRRDDTMMLCDQKGILWIMGMVRASRGFIDKKTKKILVVESEDLT